MTRRLGCREAVDRLWDHLDHDLDVADQQALDDHLAFCLRCCGELDFAREVRARLTATAPEPPADVRGRLEGFIDELGVHVEAGAEGREGPP